MGCVPASSLPMSCKCARSKPKHCIELYKYIILRQRRLSAWFTRNTNYTASHDNRKRYQNSGPKRFNETVHSIFILSTLRLEIYYNIGTIFSKTDASAKSLHFHIRGTKKNDMTDFYNDYNVTRRFLVLVLEYLSKGNY